ncbi:MAG: hypothetical protein DWQ02_03120 [Bacteroidetes bacterium]|nr:MAG: hypothetical protein DWQ02_03120 [Bacteroidota bacterium]
MEHTIKIFHWLPRVLAILAIGFISLFALDAFNPELPLGKQFLDFLMHMIPSFVLILVLLLAWKKEVIGGIIFIIIGLAFTPWVFQHNYQMNQSVGMTISIVAMISLPFVVIGILFLISHRFKKINPDADQQQVKHE